MKKYTLRGLLLFFVLCLLVPDTKGQVAITYWYHPPDITLYGTISGTSPTPTLITVDDDYSAVVPLGFSFTFYGNTYSNVVVGANGRISFDTTRASNYDSWVIDTTLNNDVDARNCICGPYCDMDIAFGGIISCSSQGVAPNRTFVLNYCADEMFTTSICDSQYTTTQIILYESTNVAEVHIAHKTACTAWNGGYAIVGVQNATGTASTVAPGRDYPSVWTATHEAWRFTPTSDSSYTVDSIAYGPMPYADAGIHWYDSTGTYLGAGDSIVVSPTVPTVYSADAVYCSDSTTYFSPRLAASNTGVLNITRQDLTVYPNPVHNELNLSTNGQLITSVVVTDLVGHIVNSELYNSQHVTVNTASLPSGIYFVKVNNELTYKFVKE